MKTKDLLDQLLFPTVVSVLSFMLIIGFNYLFNLFSSPRIIYSLENNKIETTNLVILKLENKTMDIQNNFCLRIKNSQLINVVVESYLQYQITNSRNDSNDIMVCINNIIPNSTNKVFIKCGSNTPNISIIQNATANNSMDSAILVNKYYQNWQNYLIQAGMNFVFFWIFYFSIKLKFDTLINKKTEMYKKYEDENDNLMNKLKVIEDLQQNQDISLNKQIKKLQNKLTESVGMMDKYKALQFARIVDYSKELSFWKNIIKRMLFTKEEDIFKLVTQELKTFNTQNNEFKFPEIVKHLKEITDYYNKTQKLGIVDYEK